jgi:predicted HNH restriction endonuclease
LHDIIEHTRLPEGAKSMREQEEIQRICKMRNRTQQKYRHSIKGKLNYKKHMAKNRDKLLQYNKERFKHNKKKYYAYLYNRRKQHREYFIKLFGGRCSICCNEYDFAVFDFHHLVPATKKDNTLQWVHAISTLKKKIKGCILICSNCHRSLHEKQRRSK